MKEGATILKHEEIMGNALSVENPDGIVNLAVAENTLMTDYLARYFKDRFSLRPVNFTYGDSLAGNRHLRNSLANLFNDHFHPHKSVVADELIAGAGLLPMISQLGKALVDSGNAIMLLRPYYHGFDIALESLDGIKLHGVGPVPLDDMFTIREVEYFELALQEAKASGTGANFQAVLLVNPQNPFGRCYPREVLESYCRFCEQHDLHLISDEIYALSTFSSCDNPTPTPFSSILSIDLDAINVKDTRVHMLYGMSKDFDANGFRAGVLHTRHEELYQSLLATSIFSIVSSPAAELWASLLDDKEGLAEYIQENCEALKEAYEHLTNWLKTHGVPYVPSAAGHFLMVDFRRVLSSFDEDSEGLGVGETMGFKGLKSMEEREHALVEYLAKVAKVVLNPGASLHMPEPGWCRLTFTLPRWMMDTALRRMEQAFGWESSAEVRRKELSEL